MTLALGLLFMSVLIIVSLIAPWRLEVKYYRHGKDDQLNMFISPWHVGRLKIRIPVIEQQKGKIRAKVEVGSNPDNEILEENVSVEPENLLAQLGRARWLIGNLSRLVSFGLQQIVRLTWHTRIGTGDAAATAAAVGAMWALKGSMFGYVHQNSDRQVRPEFSVCPDFNRPGFETSFHCILSFTIGHIMSVGMQILVQLAVQRMARRARTP